MRSVITRGILKMLILSFALILAGSALAQSGQSQTGTPWVGEKAIQETTAQIMARHKPIVEPGNPAHEIREEIDAGRKLRTLRTNPLSPRTSQWPLAPISSLGRGGPYLPQTVGVNFLATTISNTPGFIPPETMGDVGPSNIVVMVNGSVRVFNKTGTLDAGTLEHHNR